MSVVIDGDCKSQRENPRPDFGPLNRIVGYKHGINFSTVTNIYMIILVEIDHQSNRAMLISVFIHRYTYE